MCPKINCNDYSDHKTQKDIRMQTKKILSLTIPGLLFSLAITAQVSTTKPPFSYMKSTDTGIYAEGLVGYNRYAFSDGYYHSLGPVLPFGVSQRQWNNGTGNWAFGAIIGYQFHRNFSAEAGGFYTLKAKYSYVFSGIGSTKTTISVQPWYAFLGAKLSIPVSYGINLFAKLGAGYQKIRIKDDPNDRGNQSKWGPMFGGGLAYYFTPGIYINAQWLRFTGKIKNGALDNTAPNLFLVGLGYKFAM
jgi:opacity protein-like surface antigen